MMIAKTEIAQCAFPYIVAEISGNHGGSLERAKQLIKEAKKAGAAAVKTQCYNADTLTLNCNKLDFIVQGGLWQGKTLYELYSAACTPPEWHKELYSVAHDEGITIFSSVFDRSGIDLLQSLGCPAYKIASFEVADLHLIEYAAKTDKPIIISTGLANNQEIREAREAAGPNSAFLHCTSEYPADTDNADMWRVHRIYELLHKECPVGLSDHSSGHLLPIMATAMGAAIIEKHLKLRLAPLSEDDAFSLTPAEFAGMVNAVKQAWNAGLEHEQHANPSRQFRRSLYVVEDIREGEQFTELNIRSIRPGFGMPPKNYSKMLGRRAKKDYKRGDPLW
jgi:pseudaminic acid synthase